MDSYSLTAEEDFWRTYQILHGAVGAALFEMGGALRVRRRFILKLQIWFFAGKPKLVR